MTSWQKSANDWDGNAPVFRTDNEYAYGGVTYPYPDVWVSEQVREPTDASTGRAYVAHYTPEADPFGWEALEYGSHYYNEAMSCSRDDEDEHAKRILCFQAAELLYLHASYKGNPVADLNLGYVYSYDRCEGHYWDAPPEGGTFSCSEHAYAHYRKAAEAELGEACYKLGDLLRSGRGCEIDLDEAFVWFQRGYELGREEDPVIWGSAALRLGRAYEEGEGCEQSFAESLTWYERATTGLGIAVRGGDGWYRGALRHAEEGLARVKQELNGAY